MKSSAKNSGYKPVVKATGLRWLWLVVIVLVIDRISKSLALEYLPPYEPVSVVKFFNLALAYNTGAAFSFLGSASGWQVWLFGTIALSVSIGLLVWLSRLSSKQRWLCVALAFVLGGAMGNLCDRLLYGHVIDFLQFYVGDWYWPTFNIADSAVCVGAIMLLLDAAFSRKK